MTTYFVTRHKGAIDWAGSQGIKAIHIKHLDPAAIKSGDTILGTLPVSLAAEVCAIGARYCHLCMDIPHERRGANLSSQEMIDFGAQLKEFYVRKVDGKPD